MEAALNGLALHATGFESVTWSVRCIGGVLHTISGYLGDICKT